MRKRELIVALDFPNPGVAQHLVQELHGLGVTYKIGLELFLAQGAGRKYVEDLVSQGNRVFLDLKFHDIPNTVAQAVAQACAMGVDYFTVHLAGGPEMARSVLAQVAAFPGKRPLPLGVSVLTSFSETHWRSTANAFSDSPRTVADSVFELASKASDWGLPGVICSPHELERIKGSFRNLFCVVPGIRLEPGKDLQDQARVMTPVQAFSRGADAIVVGRPITQASHPRKVAEQILLEINPA